MTDEQSIIATAHCRCGAAVAWVGDLDAAVSHQRGKYGQPYDDGSWMVHTEQPEGEHVPRREDDWVFRDGEERQPGGS